jgi:hypothetical protein
MNARKLWSRILLIVGFLGMLVGAIDPMEGSLLILPGSGLVALGAFLGEGERRVVAYRVLVFFLIVMGVGALWGLSAVGGFGGPSGRSNWWGVLILPYLIGWSMGIWGPGSPRWVVWVGIGVGLWHLWLASMVLKRSASQDWITSNLPGIVLAVIGLLTIAGCIHRLRKRSAL